MSEHENSSSINSILFDCCLHGDLDTLRIYLKKLDPNEIIAIRDDHGATLAHHAARYGHEDILRYFLEEKELDLRQLQTEHRATCVHDAAVCDQVQVMKYLLHFRHDKYFPLRWDVRDNHGDTPLHLGR